jgi:DNA repair exonuclease SbcCD ATPase subunit
VWRHIIGDSGSNNNHIAVLNKIDGLWDVLKTGAEIEREVDRQVHSVSRTLDLSLNRVFPVSAQKGLVAKVTGDARLLAHSRLPALETALVDLLVPAKSRIVREQTVAAVERVSQEVRNALGARERGLIEQLYEMRALQGKNQSSIERMLLRAQSESYEFEDNVRRIVAARVVLSKLSEQVYENLRLDALRTVVMGTRERMRKVRLSPQFFGVVRDYFSALRELLRQANTKLREVENMVVGVQRKFAEDLGWSLPPPMAFSLDTYMAELERSEAAYKSHFGTLAVLTRDKWSLIERFFDTVVSKSREVFAAAERDTEAWVRSLLPPIEVQVREQRAQLKKRAESVQRIRDAQESLDDRISMLEDALEDAQARLAELKHFTGRVRQLASREPQASDLIAAAPAPAEPTYLRVEI